MSRKGNPYDNAMAENFFSIQKTECIYRHKPKSIQEANELIDRYDSFGSFITSMILHIPQIEKSKIRKILQRFLDEGPGLTYL